MKHISRALTLLTEQAETRTFRTAEVYDTYQKIAEQAGTTPLSYDRVQRLLK